MTSAPIRDASADDLAAIAKVAVAAGQDEEWSGSDPAYVRHLLSHGRLVVAERDGVVTGFGATRQIGPVTMLCDLFVHPRAHGFGLGRSMLDALWAPGTPRMTFSSAHPRALPLYTRAGLDAWWPLLYLAGDVAAVRPPAGWATAAADPDEVAGLEERWTGVDRSADHRAWAARPAGQPLVARRDGETLAAGVVAGAGSEYGVVHLAVAPAADAGPRDGTARGAQAGATPRAGDAVPRDAVLAVIAALDAPDGRARVCLPAPHPATRPLLAAGWRVEYTDQFMATDPAMLDPRRAVPSPALA